MPAAIAEPPTAPSAAIIIGPSTAGGAGQTWRRAKNATIEVDTRMLVFIAVNGFRSLGCGYAGLEVRHNQVDRIECVFGVKE